MEVTCYLMALFRSGKGHVIASEARQSHDVSRSHLGDCRALLAMTVVGFNDSTW